MNKKKSSRKDLPKHLQELTIDGAGPMHERVYPLWQWPTEPRGSSFAELSLVHKHARTLAEEFEGERGKLERKGHYTPEGLTVALQKKYQDKLAEKFEFLRDQVKPWKAKAAERRAELERKALEADRLEGDAAAAVRLGEIRGYLRALPKGEAARAALTGDRETKLAVASAPAYLSNVEPHTHETIKRELYQGALAEAAGDSLKPLRDLEGAVQATEAALEISERVAQRIAGFPSDPN